MNLKTGIKMGDKIIRNCSGLSGFLEAKAYGRSYAGSVAPCCIKEPRASDTRKNTPPGLNGYNNSP